MVEFSVNCTSKGEFPVVGVAEKEAFGAAWLKGKAPISLLVPSGSL